MLQQLFPSQTVTRFDAAQIDDYLDLALIPSVVVMNPPFSAMAHVEGRSRDAGFRHIDSALKRLAPGGRLVAITGANVGPDQPGWQDSFARLQETSTIVFSASIDGSVFAKHGTTVPTRLTVIDKRPANHPKMLPGSPGMAPGVATLIGWIETHVPPRLPVTLQAAPASTPPLATKLGRSTLARAAASRLARPKPVQQAASVLAYETVDWTPPANGRLTDAIYEPYALQSPALLTA